MGKAFLPILFLLVVYINDAVLTSSDNPPVITDDDDDDSVGFGGGVTDPQQPPDPQQDLIFQAPPPGCPMICPNHSTPVCATNGITYENDCLFEEARICEHMPSLTLNHTGECNVGRTDFFNFNMTMSEDEIALFSVQNIPIDESRGARRTGRSTEATECDKVYNYVPRHLTFITRFNYYRKYTHAYGIPVISTAYVKDATIKRACYVLRFLLADRRVLRESLYRNYGRVGVIGTYEHTTSIPEHSWLGSSWNQRARGLGGTLRQPISTGTEENIMCDKRTDRYRDRYPTEDIFLHEFSHGIQEVAVRGGGIRGYMGRLNAAYASARSRGLWRSTYSMSTVQEYFAEATQSYFNVNTYSARANGVHGPIHNRAKLRTYDPTLYGLVKEVFPCMNTFWKRCDAAHRGTTMPDFWMNCDNDSYSTRKKVTAGGVTNPGTTTTTTTTTTTPKPVEPPEPTKETVYTCTDKNQYCSSWANGGYCTKGSYITFMMSDCRTSCGCCNNKNVNCDHWAQYCNHASYSKFMNRDCKKTCKTCQNYAK